MKIKVSVTKKHISEGREKFFTKDCPVGLALADALPPGFEFDWKTVTLKKTVCFPSKVRKFLETLRADQNSSVKPFTFELKG